MTKKENKKQLPLSLDVGDLAASDAKKICQDRVCNHIDEKKVITTSAFTEKRNGIKTDIYNSIVNRAKHLYD